jgi:hypothetical protein
MRPQHGPESDQAVLEKTFKNNKLNEDEDEVGDCYWGVKEAGIRALPPHPHLHGMLPASTTVHVSFHDGCGDRSVHRKTARS